MATSAVRDAYNASAETLSEREVGIAALLSLGLIDDDSNLQFITDALRVLGVTPSEMFAAEAWLREAHSIIHHPGETCHEGA